MYQDCGDELMEKYAIEQTLSAHKKIYTDIVLDSRNLQRVCMISGELRYKTDDIVNTRKCTFSRPEV